MRVTKRDGSIEEFDVNQIRQAVLDVSEGLDIDVDKIVNQCQFETYDQMPTAKIDRTLIMIARSFIELDPDYSKLASRLLLKNMYLEVPHRDVEALLRSQVATGLLDERMLEFDFTRIQDAIDDTRDSLFDYMGLEMLSSRYCISDRDTQKLMETPQMFWMRVAMGLAFNEETNTRTDKALEFYDVLSNFYYTPGGRTLFQSGYKKAQMANCFLNTVPDDLHGIFKSFSDNSQYLKWSGGTGTDWSSLRATGALIKGTGVGSQGVIPFLKIANDINVAINRSGKRRGAGCVYLETWHLDIEDFLELRKNTGDERRRAHDTNTANWIPDLFMKRVQEDGQWTLFSPDEVPDLHDLYGEDFEIAYKKYEEMADLGKVRLFKRIQATDLWKKMLAMLYETGHPWITFKDAFNLRNPQDHEGVIHSSNLCTEIGLNTKPNETAVCTLGSINFAKFVRDGKLDRDLMARVIRIAMRMLDNVIDLNYYPTPDAKRGSTLHRPVGLGVRGYHDALYQLGIDFESEDAIRFASESLETVAYYAILASSELAKERGTYSTYDGSKWSRGIFPQDTSKLPVTETLDWSVVRDHVKQYGMRNSNTTAIAPTASTANLVGCIPCIEPIYKNIYTKSNKQGEFTVVNKYLIADLKKAGLWGDATLKLLKRNDGSVQRGGFPDWIKKKYKEVFEIDQKWLIRAAAERAKWIDQSQSINVFFSGKSGKELSDIYMLAWELGLKSTYYLRTLGASGVEKSTVSDVGTHKRENETATQDIEEGDGICTSCES